MLVHEGGRVANVLVGLLVLFLEDFQNALIPFDGGVVTLVDQVGDDGRLFLAIAVHPAIALLEDHE